MKIDVIVSHPYEMHYPIWERIMERNKQYFNSIIVCFTPGEILRQDFSTRIKEEFGKKVENTIFLDFPGQAGIGDWRNIATNFALDNSSADTILFMEQDLIMPDMKIVSSFKDLILTIQEKGRIHPAFLRTSRKQIEITDKNFAPIPEKKLDHFDLFISQLEGARITVGSDLYYHMAGYTDNCRLQYEGKEPNYKPSEFYLFKQLEKLL